jgi:hypothetical protein
VRLLAEQLDGNGVGLATVGDYGALKVLLWRDYPTGEPGRWKAHGTLESRLDGGADPGRRPRGKLTGRRPSRRTSRSAAG